MSLLILCKKLTGFFRLSAGKSRGLSLLFPVIILLSCGLQLYSYLYPPTDVYTRDDPSSQSEQDLIFTNAYENNLSIFTGYEVYYKVYDPLDAGTSESAYSSDVTSVTNTTGADYNTLNSLGFSRLFFTTDDVTSSTFSHDSSKPAFTPDSNLLDIDYQIRFNLNQSLSDSYKVSTFNTTEYSFSSTPYIYRWVYNDTPGVQTVYKLKQFETGSFDIYDNDLPDTLTSEDMAAADYYFYITFYIMSFGRDAYDITSSVYSDPVYLGTLKFDCSLTDNFYD